MFKNRQNPIRLRSKIYLVIYQYENDLKTLKEHLKKVFKIKLESDWLYVLKKESYSNQEDEVLVYLEFQHSSDIYSIKLDVTLNNRTIKSNIWTLSDRYLGLAFLFKNSTSLHVTDFITNISEDILEEYISIKPSNKNKSSIRENYLEKSTKKPKVFTEKQHKKVLHYTVLFDKEFSKTSPDKKLLKRYIGNIRNYRYTHHNLPSDVTEMIKKYETILSTYHKEAK